MKIIILVDSEDMKDPVIHGAVGNVLQCGTHSLHVLHDPNWQAGTGGQVEITWDGSTLQITTNPQPTTPIRFTLQSDEVVGIVISHLGCNHETGPSSAFSSVSYNQGNVNISNQQRIMNNYYQAGWLKLCANPCICLGPTYSGFPIDCIIRDFRQCNANIKNLENYLKNLCVQRGL